MLGDNGKTNTWAGEEMNDRMDMTGADPIVGREGSVIEVALGWARGGGSRFNMGMRVEAKAPDPKFRQKTIQDLDEGSQVAGL
jgi:hypothetical protein